MAEILYAMRIQRIRDEADAIWRLIAGCHSLSTNAVQQYDLRASAKNLRDVADKLDAIEAAHRKPTLVAAE